MWCVQCKALIGINWLTTFEKSKVIKVLCLSFVLRSGAALHAGRSGTHRYPAGTDPPDADAAQHHSNGPATAARLPAHRRAHHRLLLLADGHHRHHQSCSGKNLFTLCV